MHFRPVIHIIAYILLFIGLAMLCSLGVSFLAGDPGKATLGLGLSAAVTLACAGGLWVFTRGGLDLKRRDGYAVVTFGWLLASVFGTLPYLLTGEVPLLADAFFESVSGLTTTGASVLSGLESHSRGLIFWRAISQWIGGMGVLVLVVAILPFLGVGASALYRAEMPGVSKDKLTPQVASTAKALWYIYLGLTAICVICLKLCGMTWFESVCNAFCTIATGGFSTHSQSIEGFNSLAVECVVMVFMLLGGVNFALHFRALRGDLRSYFRDLEFRVMCLLLLAVIAIMTLSLWQADNPFDTPGGALRAASFECISVLTTTGFGGYGTQEFASWSVVSIALVGLLGFLGASSGSTTGGVKLVRVIIAAKIGLRELRLMIIPKAVYKVRISGNAVDEKLIARTAAYLLLFLLVSFVSIPIMTFFCPDEVTAMSAVHACLTNVGPGIGEHIGPDGNYAIIASPGKYYLTFLMLLGRLELFTLLVIFSRVFWKR